MGFYGPEPVDPKETTVTYLWTGLRTPGVYIVETGGDAPNYSYGFVLKRDQHFVGGLKIDAMGWTGPVAPGTTPYKVKGTFPGAFYEEIIISGSNGSFPIKVKEIPHTKVDAFIKKNAIVD
ncbi:hypothetical protein N9B82_00585 [Saprospiraceae bacterium]|nr:hypothetical protein [Saprospiraceae bacterium]